MNGEVLVLSAKFLVNQNVTLDTIAQIRTKRNPYGKNLAIFLICWTICFLMVNRTGTELIPWRHLNNLKVLWISNIVLTYPWIRLTWDFYYPEVRKAKMYFQNLKII